MPLENKAHNQTSLTKLIFYLKTKTLMDRL